MGRVRIAVLLALVTVLAACTNSPAPGDVERRGPAGSVPPGLERFYGQTLDWRSCAEFGSPDAPEGSDCAWLETPLDYANPAGRTVRTGVTRHRATDPDRRIGVLTTDTGGGVRFRMSAAATFGNDELRERFDVVAIDRRGSGTSDLRARCYDNADWERDRATDAPGEAKDRAYLDACLRNSGAEVLTGLGTREVARDMDVLRSALGERQLSLYGASSGTLAAIEYAERFTGSVRALVLDGPAPTRPPDVVADAAVGGRAVQRAFDEFAAHCASTPDCPLGTDPATAAGRLHALLLPLLDRPAPAGEGRSLTFSDAELGVTSAITAGAGDRARTALTALNSENGSELLALADEFYYRRDANGDYDRNVANETAVRCIDEARPDAATARAATEAYRVAAPFRETVGLRSPSGTPAPGLGSVLSACTAWPVPPTWVPHPPDAPGLPTPVLIAATGDQATPYRDGVDQARALRGRLLTLEAGTHVNYLRGNECVDEPVTRALVDGVPPEADRTCR
ncbi:alpha/beta hydrolase [Amycolatopsis antarctica]|uniref:Alpha/beta hydrolase n=1 Tax=Amycolatopsis antarctica TaxID=1854586 RepID=A0A263D783_9PSEU|nr:alpha/beta hydrolase [Amycolatopsis antarctica]OZM73346.1 alpha/beta hydrolase [Amycolatopsis antarctica]